jgi:hypothetical protein
MSTLESLKLGPGDVVCKVRFNSMRTFEAWGTNPDGSPKLLYDLEFSFVSGNESEENKKFWEASPSGQVKFQTLNAEAAKMFEFGREYYMIFRIAALPITIIVNGAPRKWQKPQISYEELVNLIANQEAQKTNPFTIQYSHGPAETPQGTLTPGQNIKIKSGMVFDVTRTSSA